MMNDSSFYNQRTRGSGTYLYIYFVSYLLIYLSFFKKIFIYFWLHWVFVAAHGLSLVVVSGGYPSLQCTASHCGGFSSCGAWALGTWASVVVALRL